LKCLTKSFIINITITYANGTWYAGYNANANAGIEIIIPSAINNFFQSLVSKFSIYVWNKTTIAIPHIYESTIAVLNHHIIPGAIDKINIPAIDKTLSFLVIILAISKETINKSSILNIHHQENPYSVPNNKNPQVKGFAIVVTFNIGPPVIITLQFPCIKCELYILYPSLFKVCANIVGLWTNHSSALISLAFPNIFWVKLFSFKKLFQIFIDERFILNNIQTTNIIGIII